MKYKNIFNSTKNFTKMEKKTPINKYNALHTLFYL